MSKISRRKMLAGAIAVPIIVPLSTGAITANVTTAASPNELVSRVAEWIAADEYRTSLQLKWQDFESRLFDKARRMRMRCDRACKSDMPEARAMRALDKEMDEIWQWLEVTAAEIRQIPATTMAGAIAKIELGLKAQGPFDWREHSMELIEEGIGELRMMVR
jgi:hypothetical protein